MNVKELKEFLKDIDDDVEIYCLQDQKSDTDGLYHTVLDDMKENYIYFNTISKQIIIGT